MKEGPWRESPLSGVELQLEKFKLESGRELFFVLRIVKGHRILKQKLEGWIMSSEAMFCKQGKAN